jgi:hypothetical protein
MSADEGLLEVLGVVEREDAISNLLRHAFVHLPDFRGRILHQIDTLPDPDLGSVEGTTRIGVSGVGVPDIILVGESARTYFYRRLRKELPPSWTFRMGSNMLAKIPFDRTATVREVSGGIAAAITAATPVIDHLLTDVVFESR